MKKCHNLHKFLNFFSKAQQFDKISSPNSNKTGRKTCLSGGSIRTVCRFRDAEFFPAKQKRACLKLGPAIYK